MACVLVTGGAGFLGTAVVRRLAPRGDRVIVLDNFQAGVPENLGGLGSNVAVFSGDITDLGGLLGLIRQHRVQRIIHTAAIVSTLPSLSAPSYVTRVNIEGTLNVLEAMRLFDVERAVHISSEEIYGAFRHEPADEEHPAGPTAPYGISKAASEQLGRFYRTVYKTDFISARTSWVYGPGFPRQRIPRTLIEAALAGRPLHLSCGGDARIDHTYLDDCVDGILLALDHPVHPFDVYNVASGEGRTLAEMVGLVKDLIPGTCLSVGPGPLWYDDRLVVPPKGALDLTRAKEVLGYRPKYNLRRGLASYIEWYRRGQVPREN
ncbi:MAG: NAD-dependent epimerase/dehydratase family protein [Deltaproteobacteria bacterium]|nr:NAD-dependent epimerase/dehydratase family protein [Deltaproteobacteria bacterium]